jgi:hypothetical protein
MWCLEVIKHMNKPKQKDQQPKKNNEESTPKSEGD